MMLLVVLLAMSGLLAVYKPSARTLAPLTGSAAPTTLASAIGIGDPTIALNVSISSF